MTLAPKFYCPRSIAQHLVPFGCWPDSCVKRLTVEYDNHNLNAYEKAQIFQLTHPAVHARFDRVQ
jgi:hypothetical protein